jgi:hypothetical protein
LTDQIVIHANLSSEDAPTQNNAIEKAKKEEDLQSKDGESGSVNQTQSKRHK